MRVQRVLVPGTEFESWTVLGDDLMPVEPVERFLSYLASIEKSPNTIKAYAHDQKDWLTYLDRHGVDWRAARLEDVAGFVAWLRLPPQARDGLVSVLPTVEPFCSAGSVNRKLSVTWNLAAVETISLRYDHGLRRCVGQGSGDGEVAGARPARAGRRLAAGVDRPWSCASDDGRLRARAGRIP
jgi:Phage integrase, N-terminal SAM-like domain